jgi:SAM-dependent methyltransferase
MARLVDITPTEGEDEPWSPTSIVFALTAAHLAKLDERSLICDLGAGGAVSSIAIAVRTRAHIYAVDSSNIAIASILRRSHDYRVSECILPIQMDACDYLDTAVKEGLRFDLALVEGGICGVVGHALLLQKVRQVIRHPGFIVLSGYAYIGVAEQPAPTNRIKVHVPDDIREHYENTMHSAKRREILDEQQMLKLIEAEGFKVRLNCRVGQNHWSSYFERMHRMAAQGIDVACQYHSAARRFGIGEAFHNLRGQQYLCYSVVIAESAAAVIEANNRGSSGEG